MSPIIHDVLRALYIFLVTYWGWMARRTKPTVVREPLAKRILFYWLPLAVAGLLLGPGEWFGHSLLRENFVPHSDLVGCVGLLLAFFGVALACRSRQLLGRNWSLAVARKADHELVVSGPYRWVRHPIYSGLLLLFCGNGLVVGDYRAFLAVAIVLASFIHKLRKEEALMAELFGKTWSAYASSTPALIPAVF